MKIHYMTCTRCGGEVQAPDLNKVNYCSYCGAPLYIDDGVSRSVNTTIIRDEARIREAENDARRLDLEEQRMRQEQALYADSVRGEQMMQQKERRETITKTASSVIGGVLKGIMAVLGILFIIIIGLAYLVSPVDLMSGIAIDDIIFCYLCIKAILYIGSRRQEAF